MSYCVRNTIVNTLKGKAKGYIIAKDRSSITIPASYYKKNIAINIAKSVYNKGLEIYGKFGNNLSLDMGDPYNPMILIHPTKQLIDAYDVKEGKKTLEEIDTSVQEDLTDYYMGDEALREQEERDLAEDITYPSDEISLYLSEKLDGNFNYSNPGYSNAPSIEDILSGEQIVTKNDIENKKRECE